MKNYSTNLKFGLWLAALLPLTSHAAMEMPYWLHPEWLVTKVMDFHARNTERIELAQKQEKAKNIENASSANGSNPSTNVVLKPSANATQTQTEMPSRKPKLAPLEYATPKINEKHLSKQELYELRMQLKQKP